MSKLIRPLFHVDTYRGWCCALAGVLLSLVPLLAAAAVLAPLTRVWSAGPRLLGFAVVSTALVALAGVPRSVRRRCVRLVNRVLRTGLPAPVDLPETGWRNRWRTAAWLLAHVWLGWAVLAGTGLLLMVAGVLVGVWLGGGDRIVVFGLSVQLPGGWLGAWVPLAALAVLLLAGHACAAAAAGFRALAPALLGPGPAERLAALQDQMHLLSQRNRLAQELHDSVGHTLTTATIQAAVARQTLDTDPETARRALSSIEESSRSALDELDHVLGVLRSGKASTAPRHTLTDLEVLLERVRQAGAEVRADLDEDRAQLPAVVSREAYRVVQEGLTNALRHAGREPISLRVAVQDDWLELELSNPLPAAGDAGRAERQGHGLVGIGERVRLLRGEVEAGPTADGHWRLLARMPLRSTP
ncbi:sensor histidine kinase [Goodfellowiella coeruleoviolacea]|uniref:histidine kinase n=1 Tax=Goodfellowiella coeruleoviolacea TaxID=334858 RepID=A0AAE3G8X8_9PSEU|nr:histidine kinase [Goodfellowiella coeruleoviolacea]MCP2163443.1 Signal transduction histidine kinase [Goodfellowiella coeruleoviolacea]